MTPPSDLPPSFTPDPSDPSGRRPARADAPPSSPPSGGARRGPAPQRRSLRTGPSADGGADSARPAPEGEGRRPARGAQAPGSSARGASHVRPGSSAMPLGGESAGGPGPTRVMPAGSSGSSGAPSRGVFPVGTHPIPEGPSHPEVQPERAPLRPRRGRRPLRWVAAILVLLLVLVGGARGLAVARRRLQTPARRRALRGQGHLRGDLAHRRLGLAGRRRRAPGRHRGRPRGFDHGAAQGVQRSGLTDLAAA